MTDYLELVEHNAELKARMSPVLWSMFPHSHVLWWEKSIFVRGARMTFDVHVPEYRLVIDFNTKSYSDIKREAKQSLTEANNYRYIVLSEDPDEARDKLVDSVNEVYLLDRDGAPIQILSPKLQGDAGWNLVCDQDMVCPPRGFLDIPSNVFLEMPNHLYGIVQARSSTSKRKLIVLPGVIDPGYRGQIFTMVHNLSEEHVSIKAGSSVSQMLFMYRVPHLHINPVSKLKPSERNDKGFGSTGA